jgi:hypothetical protein
MGISSIPIKLYLNIDIKAKKAFFYGAISSAIASSIVICQSRKKQ